MNARIAALLEKSRTLQRELEAELDAELDERRRNFKYRIERGRVYFEERVNALHDRLRKGAVAFLLDAKTASLLVSPVIYSLILPLALLDAWIWLYQAVCFPVYGIAKVERSRYIVLDRGRLGYLNWIERLNCQYCAYANGLIGYAREVAGRTEQYFCPIKHAARLLEEHARYGRFLDYGDAESYRRDLQKLRDELKPET